MTVLERKTEWKTEWADYSYMGYLHMERSLGSNGLKLILIRPNKDSAFWAKCLPLLPAVQLESLTLEEAQVEAEEHIVGKLEEAFHSLGFTIHLEELK